MTSDSNNTPGLQVAFSDDQVDRWDREWLIYLSTENPDPHLMKARQMDISIDLAGLPKQELFYVSPGLNKKSGEILPQLWIWADGDWIVNKSVLEFGSGTGFIGKSLGSFTKSFLGVDVSELAVAVATAGRHKNAEFIHVNNAEELRPYINKIDTWVAREFFIHQNYMMASQTLERGLKFLKKDGRLCADFYEPNHAVEQGVIHPAASPLDETYASCGYYYTEAEIARLADENGLMVETQDVNLGEQRRFVVFRKK